MKTCRDCAFWDLRGIPKDSGFGACRRYAPRAMFEAPLAVAVAVVNYGPGHLSMDPEQPRDSLTAEHWHDLTAAWPTTSENDWCGELQEKWS